MSWIAYFRLWLNENRFQFPYANQVYFLTCIILAGSKLKMLLKWHLFKWKAFYIKDTYRFSTMVIIHRQEDIILAPIKAFYLKKLHFNCTFSLDPVSIIYNYKQGFEEMIWISIEIFKFQNFFCIKNELIRYFFLNW
jgi:hypothetical protein